MSWEVISVVFLLAFLSSATGLFAAGGRRPDFVVLLRQTTLPIPTCNDLFPHTILCRCLPNQLTRFKQVAS